MSFELNCPACSQALEIDESLIGTSVICPACGNEFEIENKNPVKNLSLKKEQSNGPAIETPEKNNRKKRKVSGSKSVKKFPMNKLADTTNRTIKKIKHLILLILLGTVAYWSYNIYKDIYWSTEILIRILDILKESEKRVVFQSIDELKLENKSLAKLPDNTKIVKILNQYIYLFVLSQDNLTVVKSLVTDIPEDDYKVFIGDIVKICRKCNDGFNICKYCKGTRKCHICRGTGQIKVSRIGDNDTYEQCTVDCKYCSNPVICRFCRGKVFIVNRQEVKKLLPSYKQEVISLVEKKIKNYKSFSYAGKRFLDNFFAVFENSKPQTENNNKNAPAENQTSNRNNT